MVGSWHALTGDTLAMYVCVCPISCMWLCSHHVDTSVSRCVDGRIFIWHRRTGALLNILPASDDVINCVQVRDESCSAGSHVAACHAMHAHVVVSHIMSRMCVCTGASIRSVYCKQRYRSYHQGTKGMLMCRGCVTVMNVFMCMCMLVVHVHVLVHA